VSRRIQVLADAVANQIAAGEVVERPASVVKELVENALDALASRIEVRIESGGKRLIRISDDGIGMGREDAVLCLDRHATSKIRSADELSGVRTFGFRGEALPSIAAVARLSLETRPREDEVGTLVRVEGGRIVAVEDHPRQRGTTVEVRTLFHNAPVRARFLKTASAETRAVTDALISLALAHPTVAFALYSDDRPLLELPSVQELGERIGAIWGEEAAWDLIPVSASSGDVTLRGLIQRPDRVRAGFRRAHLFLRGRPFREPALLRAADRGYRTTIPEGFRPWVFLHLELPDGSADVNVHPAKAEIRFREPAAIEALVERGVREALMGGASAAPLDPRLAAARTPLPVEPAASPSAPPAPPGVPRRDAVVQAAPVQTSLFVAVADRSASAPPAVREHSAASPPAPPEVPSGPVPTATAPAPLEAELRPVAPRLWQVLDRYVLAETRDGLLLIDQHAAHERILYERIIRAFDEEGIEAQRLLFPLTIRLTPPEYEMVTSVTGLLARVGFEVEGFGSNTLAVHAVPNPHPHFDAERALREMIEELTHGSPLLRSARNQVERIAMSFACRGAVKAGQPLSALEVQVLFDELFATELPFHDVHGRPTTVRLSRAELERTFGRD